MNNRSRVNLNVTAAERQGGVVLFFALIGLVVMTLAAIALVRSVDTTTLIAGNLAFKQSATSSGDSGMEAAIGWLGVQSAATLEAAIPGSGYYNSLNKAIDLTAITWSDANSAKVNAGNADSAGNIVRYIVQRMCTHPAAAAANLSSGVSITATETNCVFSDSDLDNSEKNVKSADETNAPTNTLGSPIYRVTARISGPRNTVSYIQGFVY